MAADRARAASPGFRAVKSGFQHHDQPDDDADPCSDLTDGTSIGPDESLQLPLRCKGPAAALLPSVSFQRGGTASLHRNAVSANCASALAALNTKYSKAKRHDLRAPFR